MSRCKCNVTRRFSSVISQSKLVQFLMGLNECYDVVRSQILVLDPLPTVSKAYSMVLRIEKQKAIQNDLISNTEASAMTVKSTQYNNTRGNDNKSNQRKEDRTCEHCKAIGHLKESCFKLHGYLDWHKQLRKDKVTTKGYANPSSKTYDA